MASAKSWVSAMRLRTLPLSLSGIITGSAIAYFNGYWDWIIFGLSMLTTILFQIVSNFANDLGDGVKGTDNKDRVGPARAVQTGAISQKSMRNAVILTSLLSAGSAGALIYFGVQGMSLNVGLFYAGLAVLCIVAAITYTVGKRAYGYHGLGDIMVFIFFGLVSVMGVYSLYAKSIDLLNIMPATCIGLLSAAVLNLNNMRDYANDAKSGKKTLVVKMGPNNAKMYHTLILLLAMISMASFLGKLGDARLFLALLPAGILVIHLRKVMQTTDVKEFDPELKKVALATFALSLFLFGVMAWVKLTTI